MGEAAIGPVMLVLAVDLIVFGSLVVILITGSRDGRMSLGILSSVGIGLLKNPMIVSIVLGLTWSALNLPIPDPMNQFLSILGGAATPGALFAIGASLGLQIGGKALCCGLAIILQTGSTSSLRCVFRPASLPRGTLFGGRDDCGGGPARGWQCFILASHYRVAPQRVSASILISTASGHVTVSVIIGWVSGLY